MVDAQLVAYIKENLAKGYEAHQLHDILIDNGWNVTDVEEAFTLAGSDKPELPPAPVADVKSEPAKTETKIPDLSDTKPKVEKEFHVESHKKSGWKDAVIIGGMVLALCGVAYTFYILFWPK